MDKKMQAAEEQETVFITEADQYLFAQGTHYDIYKKLGAHFFCGRWGRRRFLCCVGAQC